jgi:hypothetical protein
MTRVAHGAVTNARLYAWGRILLVTWAIASPLLLLAVTDDWLFTGQGYLDPWEYVGFFLNYGNPEYYENAYKLARLPWILSGWLAYRIVPLTMAPYVLHAGYLLLASAGFWLLVKELFGSATVAALGAIALGFYTHFHGSGGWDYHNTAAGTLYVWALFAVSYAARVENAVTLAAAGAMIALSIHANITLVNMIPVLATHFFVVKRLQQMRAPWSVAEVLRSIGWMIAAGVAITTVMMAINLAVGRNAVFFQRLLDIVLRYTAEPSAQATWWNPWSSGWVLAARHLALPWAALLASGVVLIAGGRQPSLAKHKLVALEFITLAAIWCIWQSMGQTALDWDYFAFPLIPNAVLALVALLHMRVRSVSWGLVAAAPLLFAAPLIFAFHAWIPTNLADLHAVGIAVPGAALFALALAALALPRRLCATAFVLLISLGNSASAVAWERYSQKNGCRLGRELSAAIVDLNQFLVASDATLHKTALWFPQGETLLVGPSCTLNVEYLGYSLGGSGVPYIVGNPRPMPHPRDIPAPLLHDYAERGTRIAILTGDPQARESFERRAAEVGLRMRRLQAPRVRFAGREIVLTVVTLMRTEGTDREQRADQAR